jgi:hypothetical protein
LTHSDEQIKQASFIHKYRRKHHEQRPKQQKRIEEGAVKNDARKKSGQEGKENGEVEPRNSQSISEPGFRTEMVHVKTIKPAYQHYWISPTMSDTVDAGLQQTPDEFQRMEIMSEECPENGAHSVRDTFFQAGSYLS